MNTLYDVLGVSASAPHEVVRAAYRVLARELHPDNLKTGDAEKFKAISDAHDILGDPEKRKQYDRWLKDQKAQQKAANKRMKASTPVRPQPVPLEVVLTEVGRIYVRSAHPSFAVVAEAAAPYVQNALKNALNGLIR